MRNISFLLILVFLLCSLSSCAPTYPEERVIEALKKICREEYNIDNIEIRIHGDTIGVYIPLQKLFSTDFEAILASGKVSNLESLLQFSPEALDKVEDVLFSTSRVVLSSDKPFKFYVLKACDTELTGLTLILVGYIQDIKRVRFWDISREEYRKRVFHDLAINYPVLWQRPVEELFSSMSRHDDTKQILDKYFVKDSNFVSITPFFYSQFLESAFKGRETYKFQDLRSIRTPEDEIYVYAKILDEFEPNSAHGDYSFMIPSGTVLEYIFIIAKDGATYKIKRVIPFQYLAEDGTVKRVEFPEEKKLYEGINVWKSEFDMDEVMLEDFVARQAARRAQGALNVDGRILTTFEQGQLDCIYDNGNFTFVLGLMLKRPVSLTPELMRKDEDVVYFLDKVFRETVVCLRGYREVPWNHIAIQRFGEPAPDFILDKDSLDLYRQREIDIEELLARAKSPESAQSQVTSPQSQAANTQSQAVST
ncbi:MAG: hypothetical protein PHE61_06980 [Candidatus Omnitrophica bacterium]|nr:hypothetical protein [Candidatus Omnitrophota bacterium]